jgi:hypothetical protein
VIVADETTLKGSGIRMRVCFARERGDAPVTLLRLRAMVSPFAEVTVLALASEVTDRAELGGPA